MGIANKLIIVSGEESGVRHIREEHDNEYFYEAYKTAETQYEQIKTETQAFFNKYPEWKSSSFSGAPLPHSGSNTIAFVGERGAGKTSAMLSFSAMLTAKKETKKEDIIVLPIINPEKFERSDEIIANVLNTMIQQANKKRTDELEATGQNSAGYSSPSSHAKYDIDHENFNWKFKKFWDAVIECERVLSFLRRTEGQAYSQDQSEDVRLRLFERSEFFDLRTHIYLAVREFVNLFYKVSEAGRRPLLVIQIDDVDLNIRQGARIVEDIYQYLQVPLVAVLFASKIDQLHWLVEAHFIEDAGNSVDSIFSCVGDKSGKTEEFHTMATNFLEKLIPSRRRISLPLPLDKTKNIELIYCKRQPDCNEKCEYVTNSGETKLCEYLIIKTEDNENLAQTLLHMLYDKTLLRMPAEFHDSINYFIPNNMRTFVNLLATLSSLPDVKEIPDLVARAETSAAEATAAETAVKAAVAVADAAETAMKVAVAEVAAAETAVEAAPTNKAKTEAKKIAISKVKAANRAAEKNKIAVNAKADAEAESKEKVAEATKALAKVSMVSPKLLDNISAIERYISDDWAAKNLSVEYAEIVREFISAGDARKIFVILRAIQKAVIEDLMPSIDLVNETTDINYKNVIDALHSLVDMDKMTMYLPGDDIFRFVFSIKLILALTILRLVFGVERKEDKYSEFFDFVSQPLFNRDEFLINFGELTKRLPLPQLKYEQKNEAERFIKTKDVSPECKLAFINPYFWWSLYDAIGNEQVKLDIFNREKPENEKIPGNYITFLSAALVNKQLQTDFDLNDDNDVSALSDLLSEAN